VDKPVATSGNHAVISMAGEKNAKNLCLTLCPARIIPAVSPAGTPIMTVVCGEGPVFRESG
jgi:hypothetical protein